jgi:hypothetical protein
MSDQERQRKRQRNRFDAIKRELAVTMSRTEPSLTVSDLSDLIGLVSQHISDYEGPDSRADFRAWLYNCGLRFAHLWVAVRTNFCVEDWLLERLPDYRGSVEDLDAIERWVIETEDNEKIKLAQNAELARSLFSVPSNVLAISRGIRSIQNCGEVDELTGVVYDWILDHGETLLDTVSWPARLYRLSQDLALGWRKQRRREQRIPRFNEKTCGAYQDALAYDTGPIDCDDHATGPFPTADEQALREQNKYLHEGGSPSPYMRGHSREDKSPVYKVR